MQRGAATKLTALTARPDLIHLSDAISVAICMLGVVAGVPKEHHNFFRVHMSIPLCQPVLILHRDGKGFRQQHCRQQTTPTPTSTDGNTSLLDLELNEAIASPELS